MRRRNRNVQYMKCVNGQFTVNYQPVGASVDVVIQRVEYWLLKWEHGQVVKRRRLKEDGRWPKGYSLAAELTVAHAGMDCLLTVYARNVMTKLNPYLAMLHNQSKYYSDVMTRLESTMGDDGTVIEFKLAS